jgi:hypothetical protein
MSRATGAQIAERLRVSTKNEQVCNAALCAQTYLPPLFASHGHLLDAATKKELGTRSLATRNELQAFAP